MADLGNLYFGLHFKDVSEDELNRIIKKVQAKLEGDKIKLGVDFDQKTVDELVSKISKVRKNVGKKVESTGKDKKINVPVTFDKSKAEAEAKGIEHAYRVMFENIAHDNRMLEQEERRRRERFRSLEKKGRVLSKQDRVKADADAFAEAYYKRLKNVSRTLGRELDSIYVDRKAGIIGGANTSEALKLLTQYREVLNSAARDYKEGGVFNRGLLDRINNGDIQDAIRQARLLISEEKKLNSMRRRNDADDKRRNAEMERDRNKAAASMRKHAVVVTAYDSIDYKREMSLLRDHYRTQEGLSRRANQRSKKDAAEISMISREVKKLDHELAKIDLEKRLGNIGGEEIEKAIARLKDYKETLERVKYDDTHRGDASRSIRNGFYGAAIRQVQLLIKEEKALASERKKNEIREARDANNKIRSMTKAYRMLRRLDTEAAGMRMDMAKGVLSGDEIEKAIAELERYRDALKKAIREGKVESSVTPEFTREMNLASLRARQLALTQRLANTAREESSRQMMAQNRILRDLNAEHGKEHSLISQLKNELIDLYSIYTIQRFTKSVIEIGGEFQKQRIALRSILGDVAKADDMFSQIKELAIESPFNFRDLMGFTKQIAAFGIQYDEMYDTTKRLADISAGLGVDMGRIILAYGQVRSAAVLRGLSITGSSATCVAQNENSFNCWDLCA